MPLWYLGTVPLNSDDVVSNGYTKSLGDKNLTQPQVNGRINVGFPTLPSSLAYALNDDIANRLNDLDNTKALATKTFVTEGNSFGQTNGKLLASTIGTGGGPIVLDSSGKIPKAKINIPSTQRWPSGLWSAGGFSGMESYQGGEVTVATIPITPTTGGNYQLFVTGTINARTDSDGSPPAVYVRVGAGGPVVAFGFGTPEWQVYGGGVNGYTGSTSYAVPDWADETQIVCLGGGGGGNGGGGGLQAGGGGGAGGWAYTLIGKTNATLAVNVGGGGAGATATNFGPNPNAQSGGTTSVYGWGGSVSAGGGRAGQGQGVQQAGYSPGSINAYGVGYSGGAGGAGGSGTVYVAAGNGGLGAGGGGGGGVVLGGTPGGNGGGGAVWIRSYAFNQAQISVFPTNGQLFSGNQTLYVNVVGSLVPSSLNPKMSVAVVPA
jgi:hypothetical protein